MLTHAPDHDEECIDEMRALLGSGEYDAVFREPEDASGLPNVAYTSDAWLALENERLFRRNWVFMCVEAAIPTVGSMKTGTLCGIPIFAVRVSASRIKVFQNVCRHRGARLVPGDCQHKAIRCPYHHWTYALDGKLRSQPHFHGPDQHGQFENGGGPRHDLIEVPSATLFGCVFVNFSGTAEPIEETFAPVLESARGYDLSAIRWAGQLDYTVEANWKLVFENYIENYHVFAVHPRLGKFVPMTQRAAGGWTGNTFENGYEFRAMEAGRGEGMPHYPGLSEENASRGIWFMTLPNFAAEIYPDQFTILIGHPDGPTRTREELHVFLIGDEAASGEAHAEGRASVLSMWDDLNKEDLGVLELLQQGRNCPGYDGGRISPFWETPTLQFGQKILMAMATRRERGPRSSQGPECR